MRRVARMRRRRAWVLGSVYVAFFVHLAHGWWAGETIAPLEFSQTLPTLHRGVLTAGCLFAVAALAGTLVFGRFFCGWGCHFLAAQDLAAAVLARVGVRGEAPRWRSLRWVPAVLVGYLYLWPLLPRLLGTEAWPAGQIELWTEDVWQGMPGPGITLLSFAVGAFALVAVAGPRAFCHTVCPYGVFFGGADRLASRRVVLTGGCTGCNRCTVACLSGVDVLSELRLGGAVRDASCMRDLDCVAACPNGALAVAPAPIVVFPKRPEVTRPPWGEELAVVGLTLFGFLVFRGLYGEVPVLLALPAGVLLAVMGMRGFTTLRADTRGRWTRDASVRVAAAAAILTFVVHSAVVRSVEVHAARAEAGARSGDAGAIAVAVGDLEWLRGYGLYVSPTLRSRLASLYLRQGDDAAAASELRLVVAADPTDMGAARALAAAVERAGNR